MELWRGDLWCTVVVCHLEWSQTQIKYHKRQHCLLCWYNYYTDVLLLARHHRLLPSPHPMLTVYRRFGCEGSTVQDSSDMTAAVCSSELGADLTGPVNGQKPTGNTLLFIFFFGGCKEFHPGALNDTSDWLDLIGCSVIGGLNRVHSFLEKKKKNTQKSPCENTHAHSQWHTLRGMCVQVWWNHQAPTFHSLSPKVNSLCVKGSKWPQWNLHFPNVHFKTILTYVWTKISACKIIQQSHNRQNQCRSWVVS